jgi:hypothetical protein
VGQGAPGVDVKAAPDRASAAVPKAVRGSGADLLTRRDGGAKSARGAVDGRHGRSALVRLWRDSQQSVPRRALSHGCRGKAARPGDDLGVESY